VKRDGMILGRYVSLIAVVLFLIGSLSSCNETGNTVLNGKNLVIEKMKGIHIPTGIGLKTDTSKDEHVKIETTLSNELTGDFRYDNLYK